MPDEPEAQGLLALLLLTESRRAARTSPDGAIVLLPDQDRRRWDRAMIDEAQAIVRMCLRRDTPGTYQLQAAINAVHSAAPTAADTDWGQILELYDQLLLHTPTPVVALNRAVAVAQIDGPDTGLAAVDFAGTLDGYYLFHATRADLLATPGANRIRQCLRPRAIDLATNAAEIAFMTKADLSNQSCHITRTHLTRAGPWSVAKQLVGSRTLSTQLRGLWPLQFSAWDFARD